MALTIGDFARLGGVSARMLRHYDAIGLLHPARTNASSGYRYYEAAQLTRLNQIVAFRDVGFGLDEISILINAPAAEIERHLAQRRTDLAAALEADRQRLAAVDARLHLIRGEDSEPSRAFVERALPRMRLVQLTDEVEDAAELEQRVGPLFEKLIAALAGRGIRPTEPSFAWYDSSADVMRFGVGFTATTDAPVDGTTVADLAAYPSGLSTIHHGSIREIAAAWQALAREVDARGLDAIGPGREVYHQSPLDRPHEWVVELQLPTGRG